MKLELDPVVVVVIIIIVIRKIENNCSTTKMNEEKYDEGRFVFPIIVNKVIRF